MRLSELQREHLEEDVRLEKIGERNEDAGIAQCEGCLELTDLDELREGGGYCRPCVREYAPNGIFERIFRSRTADRVFAVMVTLAAVYFATKIIEGILGGGPR